MKLYRIKKSKIDNRGRGLYAAKDIKAGTKIINYVGKIADPKDDAVTVEHIIDVFAEQFPEFLLALAEENWINGYTQALNDLKYTNKNEKLHQTKKSQAK